MVGGPTNVAPAVIHGRPGISWVFPAGPPFCCLELNMLVEQSRAAKHFHEQDESPFLFGCSALGSTSARAATTCTSFLQNYVRLAVPLAPLHRCADVRVLVASYAGSLAELFWQRPFFLLGLCLAGFLNPTVGERDACWGLVACTRMHHH